MWSYGGVVLGVGVGMWRCGHVEGWVWACGGVVLGVGVGMWRCGRGVGVVIRRCGHNSVGVATLTAGREAQELTG